MMAEHFGDGDQSVREITNTQFYSHPPSTYLYHIFFFPSLLYFLSHLSIDSIYRLYCFSMAASINLGDAFVPSDDGMSDILHNAGHAYTMYLDGKDTNDEQVCQLMVF
jgi:hypothetical protein